MTITFPCVFKYTSGGKKFQVRCENSDDFEGVYRAWIATGTTPVHGKPRRPSDRHPYEVTPV
jgi:hypothetical protein